MIPTRLNRTLPLTFLLFCISTGLFAQDSLSAITEKAKLFNPVIGNHSSRLLPVPVIKQAGIAMKPARFQNFPSLIYPPQPGTQRLKDEACEDSSFFKVFETADRNFSFFSSAKTNDGGIVMAGFGRNKLEGPPYLWYGIVTKFNKAGHHIWSRELKSDVTYGLYIESISELSDGSILVTGQHENPLSTSAPNSTQDFFVAKISSIGDLLWYKTFHSSVAGNCSVSTIRYVSIAESPNGELYLGGTIPNCSIPMNLIVLKLSSTGDLIWDYTYTDPSVGAYCLGIFFDGSSITVINRCTNNSGLVASVDLLRLSASAGSYISHKSWVPDLPYPDNFNASFLNWTPQALKLQNGNYCVYGQTIGDANIAPTDVSHFSVLEFNSSYDFVKGSVIHSSLVTNLSESKIEVDRYGRVVYQMTTLQSVLNKTKYYGMAANGLVLHQRKKQLLNYEYFYDNLELLDDGSCVYINTLASPGQANFYLHYSLLHSSDPGSQCLGMPDNFSYVKPINYAPSNFTWPPAQPGTVIKTTNQNTAVYPVIFTESSRCSENSFCDTLKIHGNASSCNYQQDFSFTVFKNRQCGSAVNWFIDTSVVQSAQMINDTTLKLRLSRPWQGWLYAEISTSCGKLRDSLLLTVTNSPGQVYLGPDTSICPLNNIKINAHKGYTDYLWNTGSTDSVISVTMPGTYYVAVKDACGNSFRDTIFISHSAPIPFDIGADRIKCNKDTIHLTAPGGFLNYTWGPSYNISSQNAQQVIVQPGIDTFYFVRAEKTAGCFAFDTVRIKVNTSPIIQLGADRSLCSGDSALLNAGSGFTQYLWSNGSTAQQVTVYNKGDFSIAGTTAEGCRSFDTLRIVNVWPNPVVSLNGDTSLCMGSSRILQAGSFPSYLWQDLSKSSSFTVRGTGTYYVTVTDNNQCRGSDTVHITKLLPFPANFLPADTAVCNYSNLFILPNSSYNTYLWSNHSTASSIKITDPGLYWLQVTDTSSCVGRDTILVNPKGCVTGFFVPNAFTPNNDQLNDVIHPLIGGNIVFYEFSVFNRWGTMVFATKEINRGWDGTLKGYPQDPGLFTWKCIYQFAGSLPKTANGTVLLVR